VIGAGGLFFVGMFVGGKSVSGLAVPGTIISGIGLLLLYQNFTGHWESWAYGWTVILMFVGLGIWIMGLWAGDARQRHAGLQVLKVGAVLFVIFGALFEFVFFGFGGPAFSRIVFPVLLIVVGLYLVVRRTLWPARPAAGESNPPPIDPAAPPTEPPQA
jgi:hypothetical protein